MKHRPKRVLFLLTPSLLLGLSACDAVGVATTFSPCRTPADIEKAAMSEPDPDGVQKPKWTKSELETRADHLVAEAERELQDKKDPPSKRALAWQKVKDFASEAKELAATDLPKANKRYQEALDQRSVARVTEEIAYSDFFRVHSGAATIRPYTIVDEAPARRLTASTETSWYAEADFLYRTAWLRPEQIDESLRDRGWNRLVPQDYEIRLGFIDQERIRDESDSDGAFDSASATVSGDWYTEGTLGWVLGAENIFYDRDGAHADAAAADLPRGTWNFELNGGFTTDRVGLNTTGYVQAGLGTTWGIPITIGGTKKMATLAAGVYYGVHEFPRVDDDNRIYSTEATVPFNRLGALGVKIDFTVPMTNGIDVVLQARHFSALSRNDVADDWSLFAGVTIPIGRLVRDLFE